MSRHVHPGVAALPLVLWPALGLAQDREGVALPAITVEAGAAPGGGSLTVPSVAAQRDAVRSAAGSVAFVDAASFADRYTNNLADALKDTPGVLAEGRYGQEIRLSVRGSGVARSFHLRGVELLQDGIPLNAADGSGDFYQVDPLGLRSIEVFRGGNALAFGSSALGGAVNVVTPTAFTATAPALVRVEGGSFGSIRGNVQAAAVEGSADALLSYTYSHQDGFRQHGNQDYHQLNGNAGYAVAPGIETRFYGGIYRTRQKLPGTLTLPEALATPTRAGPAAIAGNQKRDVYAERLANRTSFALDGGKLDVDSWLVHKRLFHPIFQVVDQDGITYGVSPRWSGGLDLGGLRNDLTVGGRFFGGGTDARQSVNVSGRRGAPTADARQDARNYQAFVEDRLWATPELALVAGAKLFRDERDLQNRFTAPFRNGSRTYEGINPKVGVLYAPTPEAQVFANLTRSRDVPDFSDLAQANPAGLVFVPLAAQRALTGEVGARGSWDRFRWDLTLYRSEIRDELINFSANAALGIPAATFNADRTLHQGVEFAGAVDLVGDLSGAGDTITLAQVWTANDFRFVRDRVYGGNRIAAVPVHVLRTTLSYTRPGGFYVTPSLDWVPRGAFADHANTLRTPGYALLGIRTGMDVGGGLSVYVDARNLAGARYVSDLGAVTDARIVPTAIFYPGEGRSVFAGLRRTF